MLMPLKLKYRNPNCRLLQRAGVDPPGGTWTFAAGKNKATVSNSGKGSIVKTIAPRRKSYGPWF